MTTIGEALDIVLRGDDSLVWFVAQLEASSDAALWAKVCREPVELIRDPARREALASLFSVESALYAEAMMVKAVRGTPGSVRRYQADLHGAGTFPLQEMYPSTRAAAAAVCAALNADFQHLNAPYDPDSENPVLLQSFSDLVESWSLESDWHCRLCDAALLPDAAAAGCADGAFALCSDNLIHFMCQGVAGTPCVEVAPFDPTLPEAVFFVVDVSPVPCARTPEWLAQSTVEMEGRNHDHATERPVATYAFETAGAAHRARTFFRLTSAVVSNVYTVDKPRAAPV